MDNQDFDVSPRGCIFVNRKRDLFFENREPEREDVGRGVLAGLESRIIDQHLAVRGSVQIKMTRK